MILFRLIIWPYVRKHVLRSLLTTVGIVLGVALFVAMHTANESVVSAFRQTVDRIAGTTQLQITAGDAGFDENVLERVQSLAELRAAAPVVEAIAATERGEQGNILVLGVDMTGDQNLRDYSIEGSDDGEVDDPLVFLAQPDSVVLTKTFAQQNGLKIGSRVPMETMQGRKVFTVRGLMRAGGLASAFGGNLMVMDIYAAQKVFGRGEKFDRIDVAVKDGFTVQDVKTKLTKLLGPGFQVREPSARGNEFDSLSQVFSAVTDLTSAFALFIGIFIINNTLQIAVTHRRAEIGILRALGATRFQIMGLFLGEGAVAGLVGSAVGVALGAAGARAITSFISTMLAQSYGVAQRAENVTTSPAVLLGSILLGVATSVVAALIPARNAARVDPVTTLQKGTYLQISRNEARTRTLLAVGLLFVSGVCLFAVPWRGGIYISDLSTVLAAILLVPAASMILTRLWRVVLRIFWPVEGAIAADSILQAPRRSAGAISALTLSLALIVALGGIAQGAFKEIKTWLTAEFSADLYVSPTQSLTSREFRFPASVLPELQAISGVARVEATRALRVGIGNIPTLVIAGDPGFLHRLSTLSPVAGEPDTMYRLAASGKGVLASETFALLRGVHLGDKVDIPSPSGVLHLPIVGIVREHTDQQGSLIIARDTFARSWDDTSVNLFGVFLRPGVPEDQVRQAIARQLKDNRRFFLFSNGEVRKFVLDLANQWFGTTYIQIGIAILVGTLGIVNALTVSITDRRRELGVLRAVGGLRGQVRRSVWIEGVLIGAVGLTLGLLVGGAQLFYSLHTTANDISGVRLSYLYPYQLALTLGAFVLAVAFVAALAPAESVVRSPLVAALECE